MASGEGSEPNSPTGEPTEDPGGMARLDASPAEKLLYAQQARRVLANMFGAEAGGAEAGAGEPRPRFELAECLGEGGMGVVYAAKDPKLGRKVALKLLALEHPELRRRFVREAKAMARLSHPNVVQIHDAGELDEQAYIAMEFVDGLTLRAWLGREPRSPAAILEVFSGAGRGLAEAHARGLVHRDFKPSNVMVDGQDRARVMDFGLARMEEGGSIAGGSGSVLTRTGMVLGTPAYMSPEQVQGVDVGPRSDQFSFCVALWEALHGERPFADDARGDGLPTFVELDERAPEAALGARADLPQGVHQALTRGLRLDAQLRFEDMGALLDALASRAAGETREAQGAAGTIAHYTILKTLGEGGMGVVYLGYEAVLDRKVAIKLLRRSRRHSDAALARFGREAKALARVEHPNVVEIYGFGPCAEGLYIAMEYVEGQTLGDWLGEAERDWRETLGTLVEAGRGLAAAHEHQLVHRDFKGSNVMVGQDGRARVLDFGLVRSTDTDTDTGTDADALTAEHTQLGTRRYMALEQLEGGPVDARTDQFTFCVVAFEALYGLRPFAGATATARALAMRGGTLEERPAQTEVPRRVHAALVRGMAADPEGRWPDMDALLAELAECLAHDRRRGWLLVGLGGGVAAALVIAVAAWIISGLWAELHAREGELELANASLAEHNADLEARQRALERQFDVEQALALTALAETPGGRAKALVQATTLYACHLQGLEGCASAEGEPPPWQLEAALFAATRGLRAAWERDAHEGGITALAFEPHGTRVATAGADNRAVLWDARTGAALSVLERHAAPLTSLEFSADGSRLLTASADGTAALWLTDTGALYRSFDAREVAAASFAPDGASLVVASVGDSGPPSTQLRVWPCAVGEAIPDRPAEVFEIGGAAAQLLFSPEGEGVVVADGEGAARLVDMGTGEVRASFEAVVGGGGRTLVYSPDGRRIASVGADGRVRLWTGGGRSVARLESGHHSVMALAFSPDGAHLVSGGSGGRPRIWASEDGRALGSLDGHGLAVRDLLFDLDGATLATLGTDSTVRLWSFGLRGERGQGREFGRLLDTLEGQRGVLLRGAFSQGTAAPGGLGSRLAVADSEGQLRVWTLEPLTDTAQVAPGARTVAAMALTPDGAAVATADRERAVVQSAATGAVLAVLPRGAAPISGLAFAPDGRTLAAGDGVGGLRLWAVDAERVSVAGVGDEPEAALVVALELAEGSTAPIRHVLFSADGGAVIAADDEGHVGRWSAAPGPSFGARSVERSEGARVSSLAASRDGSRYASATITGRLSVWDEGGAQLGPPRQLSSIAFALAFDPEGERLAVGVGGAVELWPSAGDRASPLARMEGEDALISSLAFSPDGARLATGGDLHLRLWSAQGERLAELEGHGDAVLTLAFVGDASGDWLVSGSADGGLRRALVSAPQRLSRVCEALAQTPEGGALTEFCPGVGE